MSLSPLQYLAFQIVLTTWALTVIALLVSAYFTVRAISTRSKIKASIKRKERKSLYEDYSSIQSVVLVGLVTGMILTVVNIIALSGLTRDLYWDGVTLDGFTRETVLFVVVMLFVLTLLFVLVIATKPWRTYKETVWNIEDKARSVPIAAEQAETGPKEPTSV